MSTTRRCIVAGALLALAAGGTHSVQASSADLAPRNSPNLEYVTATAGIAGGGTDFEFLSRTLATFKDATGALVTPPAPVERHFALVGNQTSGAKVVDVTDPTKPFVAASVTNCTLGQGDIQITKDGLTAAIAGQSGTCKVGTKTFSSGSALIDLSNIYAPKPVGFAANPTGGAHNNTIHPSGKYLYISTSALAPNSGTNSIVPIFDISNPAAPVKVQDFPVPGNGPHDIRFSADGKRAYFAGISAYNIVNVEDPTKPVVISRIVPPGGSIGHDTLITADKRFLFLGDEGGGGAAYPCPGGAVYAYDVSNEATPVLLGLAEAGGGPVTNRNLMETPGSTGVTGCTAHVMDLNPDGKSFTIGWYGLGTRTFSFKGFYNADGTPKTTGNIAAAYGSNGVGLVETGYMIPENANTWSAKQYSKVPGFIFSDDINLGFYVTRIKA